MNRADTQHHVARLCQIMSTLRSAAGCPWDREQTPESLKPYILEEACELLEAIDSGNMREIQDELGDLLLQIVFMAQIYKERNCFDLADVAESICAKMIRRHPHVFADATVAGHARRWEEIKSQERKDKGHTERLAQRIPATLPALKRAQKLIKKLQPDSAEATLTVLADRHQQLEALLANPAPAEQAIESAMAEILMLTTQLTAALNIDAEDLLRRKTTAMITAIDEQHLSMPAHD